MSLTVVGSIAYDAVKTPAGERERMLGGAATHFALAASFFDEVRVVGPVGDDFDEESWQILGTRGTITDDVERVAGGKTFFWRGEYHARPQHRARRYDTELNVFEHFEPKLSAAAAACDVLFLANIQPDLQRAVREQCAEARFVAMDSMDLWINIARDSLDRDDPRRRLPDPQRRGARACSPASRTSSARRARSSSWGPSAVVAKQGKYGAALFTEDGYFALPAYPLEHVVDPTGAGDTFAGGFVGSIAAQAGEDVDHEAARARDGLRDGARVVQRRGRSGPSGWSA